MEKVILHLCADIGSDSYFYSIDPEYEVLKVGKDIGVENFSYTGRVQGIIANPPCTEFKPFIPYVEDDNGFRSLCSQGFAKAFYECNT